MPKIKNTLIVSSSLMFCWIIFEILVEYNYKKKFKKQLKKIMNINKIDKYKSYYSNSFSIIASEINNIKDSERVHTQTTLKKTFLNRSTSNLSSLVNQLELYKSLKFTCEKNNANSLLYTQRILWYPYICRFFFTFLNSGTILFWKWKYNFQIKIFRKHYIYKITPKNNRFSKTMIIFIGFGGILKPFDKIINFLMSNDYQIIIPMYGPTQASLIYNPNCHEAEFHMDFYEFLLQLNIKDIEITCWSLGGILYKGFEKVILNFQSDYQLNIKKVFLFEPLLGIRGSIDTYFFGLRGFNDTLGILNSVTRKKYAFYNKVFSYFLHTNIGYSTSNSFGWFTNVEIKSLYNYEYPRYLFLSSDDIVLNYNLDKELVDSNFDKNNLYHRKGYHGGWLASSQVLPILNKLIK